LNFYFGGDRLPCSDFNANALYFNVTTLSYNLFALLHQLLPGRLLQHRAMTIPWKLYRMAAKVVKTGRQLFVKRQLKNQQLLNDALIKNNNIPLTQG
jgi:hypothetical protein